MYNILIVDDEYYICEGLKKQIELLASPVIGEIRTSSGGEQALALCESYRPQIVFTDIKMEGMDRISLIQALSRRLHPVQFIVLSGYDDFHYVRGAFQSGATDYLLKPILTEDLSRILATVIASLDGRTQNPDQLRKTLFQLSADVFHELSFLPVESPLPAPVLADLEETGITGSCCAAILIPCRAWPYEALVRELNLLYDVFDGMLGHPLAGNRIGILCDAALRQRLAGYLSQRIRPRDEMLAASLTCAFPLPQAHRALRRAEELLCLRIFSGYGRLFTEKDGAGKADFTPRLKHLMVQFIETPALVANPPQRSAFSQEVKRLSLPALIRFYSYFNEILGVAFSDNGFASSQRDCPSLGDFPDASGLEGYFYQSLEEYAEKKEEKPRSPGSMEMVRCYIDAHYMEELTLASLAERFFMSYSYLSKSFHKAFRMPFQQYLLMLRMEHALELLKDPSLSIQQIAAGVGYENAFNFSRAFKSRYGVSPSHFRNGPGEADEPAPRS